jgi:Xaa-Pro aminopeptidase
MPEAHNPAENVSDIFDPIRLHEAQAKAWVLLEELAKKIEQGMTESVATEIYKKLQIEAGADKYWHPPKIRFSQNSLKSFREPSVENVTLKANDIFFLDIGPIFDGYEADVGKTFVLGMLPEAVRVVEAGREIFELVKKEFLKNKKSGAELYAYAERLAEEQGYALVGEGANGHRVSDFPHAIHYRGNLRTQSHVPTADRWILEIQLRDLKNQIGSFHEDILY